MRISSKDPFLFPKVFLTLTHTSTSFTPSRLLFTHRDISYCNSHLLTLSSSISFCFLPPQQYVLKSFDNSLSFYVLSFFPAFLPPHQEAPHCNQLSFAFVICLNISCYHRSFFLSFSNLPTIVSRKQHHRNHLSHSLCTVGFNILNFSFSPL